MTKDKLNCTSQSKDENSDINQVQPIAEMEQPHQYSPIIQTGNFQVSASQSIWGKKLSSVSLYLIAVGLFLAILPFFLGITMLSTLFTGPGPIGSFILKNYYLPTIIGLVLYIIGVILYSTSFIIHLINKSLRKVNYTIMVLVVMPLIIFFVSTIIFSNDYDDRTKKNNELTAVFNRAKSENQLQGNENYIILLDDYLNAISSGDGSKATRYFSPSSSPEGAAKVVNELINSGYDYGNRSGYESHNLNWSECYFDTKGNEYFYVTVDLLEYNVEAGLVQKNINNNLFYLMADENGGMLINTFRKDECTIENYFDDI